MSRRGTPTRARAAVLTRGRPGGRGRRRSPGLRDYSCGPTEAAVAAPCNLRARAGMEGRRFRCLAGLEGEKGGMTGTPNGVSAKEPLRKGTAVMRTSGANRVEIVAATY